MKALPKLLFALTAVAALSFACPAKAVNLIQNPGFEDGAVQTAWTIINAGLTTAQPHSGSWSASLGFSGSLISQSVATTPNATYTINLFVLAFTAGTTFNVTFGDTVFSQLFAAATNGYVELTFNNVTASGANTLLSFTTIGGPFLLDDVSVEPAGVGVPDGGTTASLLGCALLGLVGLRRRLSC